MFSGLVEEKVLALKLEKKEENLKLTLQRPTSFKELKKGKALPLMVSVSVLLTLIPKA